MSRSVRAFFWLWIGLAACAWSGGASEIQARGAAWDGFLKSRPAPFLADLSERLRLPLGDLATRAALAQVLRQSVLPAAQADPRSVAATISLSLEHCARQRAAALKAASAAPAAELEADLSALSLLRPAVPAQAQAELDESVAAYRGARALAPIEDAARRWRDKEDPGAALAGAPAAPTRTSPSRLAPFSPAARARAKSEVPAPAKAAASRAEVPLGDVVAFLRALDSLPPAEAGAFRRHFSDWFEQPGLLGRDIAALKSRESLAAARLDTAINNQAGERDDAAIELINNGGDATLDRAGLQEFVGRFGVGAFQAFQELRERGDQLIYETAASDGRVRRLIFTAGAAGVSLRLEAASDPSFKRGTLVRVVKAGGLSAARQASLKAKILSKLGHSQRLRLTLNGETINPLAGWKEAGGQPGAYLTESPVETSITDRGYAIRDFGTGMSDEVLFSKLLLPRRGTKAKPARKPDAPVALTRLFYRGDPRGKEGGLTRMRVVLAVSGVKVEEFTVEGLQLPEEVVVELPPSSWLPESRDHVAVTPEVWQGLKGLMDTILRQDLETHVGLLNAFSAVAAYLENPRTHPEAGQSGESFARYVADRLDRVPFLKRVPNFEGGRRAYLMPFKDKSRVYLEYGDSLIFDQEVYERHKDFPVLLNLLLNFHIGYGDKKPEKGRFAPSAPPSESPATAARPSSIERKLRALPWYATLEEEARTAVGGYAAGLLDDGKDMAAILRHLRERIEPVARLAAAHMPEFGWWRQLPDYEETPYVDRSFLNVGPILMIGGQPAFVGDNDVYLGGRKIWSAPLGEYNSINLHESGGRLLIVARRLNSADVIVDQKVVRFEGQEPIESPRLIGGAVVCARTDNVGRLRVEVDGKVAWSHQGPPTQNISHISLHAAGSSWVLGYGHGPDFTRLAFSVIKGGKTLHALEDGHYWGPAVLGDKAAALVKSGESWRLFLDGQPTGEPFDEAYHMIPLAGGHVAFMGVRDGQEAIYVDGQVAARPPPGMEFRGIPLEIDGQLAYYLWRKDDEDSKRLIVGGQTAWTGKDREHPTLYPFSINGKRVVKVVSEQRGSVSMDSFWRVFAGKEMIHSGYSRDPFVFPLGPTVGILTRDGWDSTWELYVGAKRMFNLHLVGDHFAASGEELIYAEQKRRGEIHEVHRFSLKPQEKPAWKASQIGSPEVAAFMEKHALDLRDRNPPWGWRLMTNLLAGRPSEDLAAVLPLTPFLGPSELARVSPETARLFARVAEGESWDKIEQAADFFHLTRGLTDDREEWNLWCQRWLEIVSMDWARAKEFLAALKSRQPLDAKRQVDGYVFLQRNADPKTAPGAWRGYFHYLRSSKAELLKERAVPAQPAAPSGPAVIEGAPLAVATLARRQRASLLEEPGLSLPRYKTILDGLSAYSLSGLEEEISSAIIGQDKTNMLWTRELIQNARDALRKAWREGTLPRGTGHIEVDSYKSGGEWVVSVQDPVGMSLETLVKFFLPLDESDKARGVDAGFFGQGLYSLFGDFDEVRVRTSLDGKGYDIAIHRLPDGRLAVKRWAETGGLPRGTRIERVKRLDRRQGLPLELEAAFVTQSVYEYGGAIEDAGLRYQGERVNPPGKTLARLPLGGLGELKIRQFPSLLPTITVDDLPVTDPALAGDLLSLCPEWMARLFHQNGLNIDLPAGLSLERSRMGLAQREDVMPLLRKALFAAAMPLAVRLYLEKGTPIPGLPEDFYYNRSFTRDRSVDQDISLWKEGRWLEIDWQRYAHDPQALAQLVSGLEVKIAGKTLSLGSARASILSGAGVGELPLAAGVRSAMEQAAEKVRGSGGPGRQAAAERVYSDEEARRIPALRLFQELNMRQLRLLGPARGWEIRFFSADTEVVATYSRSGGKKILSWNLAHCQDLVDRWQAIAAGDKSSAYDFYYRFLETFVHEYTHDSDRGWTHDSDEKTAGGFAWRMKRNFERLLRANVRFAGQSGLRKATMR